MAQYELNPDSYLALCAHDRAQVDEFLADHGLVVGETISAQVRHGKLRAVQLRVVDGRIQVERGPDGVWEALVVERKVPVRTPVPAAVPVVA